MVSSRLRVACFLLLCLLLPAVAAPSAQAALSPTGSLVDNGPVRGTEVSSLRSEYAKTLKQADGSMRTVISPVPINFKDAQGAWQPIDNTLVPSIAGSLINKANAVGIRLPGDISSAPAKIADGERWVSFALKNATASAPKVTAGEATYADVVGSTDAVYQPLAQGLKETLVLQDASAASSYAFTLDASAGLTASLEKDGSIGFRDTSGERYFVLPQPTVQEDGQFAPLADHVSYKLSEDTKTLTVTVDADWLKAAKFPVKVDPTVYPGPAVACTLTSGTYASTPGCNQATMGVGSGLGFKQHAALRFPGISDPTTLKVLAHAQVTTANFRTGYQSQTATGTDQDVDLYELQQTLGNNATWNTTDGSTAWTTLGGSVAGFPVRFANKAGYVGGLVQWDISDLVDKWRLNPVSQNNGIMIRLADESVTNYLTLSGPAANPATTTLPQIIVNWTDRLGTERDQSYQGVGIDDRSGVKVNVASGNVAIDSTDVTIPGVGGLDLAIGRTYNSANLGDNREFSWAWSASINGASTDLVRAFPNDVQLLRANSGAVYRFTRDGLHDTSTTRAYNTPPGIDADMSVDKTTEKTVVTFRKSATRWEYDAPQVWLTDAVSSGRLRKIVDRNGRSISLNYNSYGNLTQIIESHGRTVTINTADTSVGDHQGITSIVYQGRTWTYGYTVPDPGTNPGKYVLTSFKNPDNKTVSYTYLTGVSGVYDQITGLTDARNNQINWTRDGGTTNDLATMTRRVDGTSNDVTTAWDFTPDAGFGSYCTSTGLVGGTATAGIVGSTVQTDPNGNKTTYCYNNRGQVLQTFDAKNRQRSGSYTATSNVKDISSLVGTGTSDTSLSTFTFSTNGLDNLIKGETDTANPSGTKQTSTVKYCDDPSEAACTSTDKFDEYRPSRATGPDNTVSQYVYDTNGNTTNIMSGGSPTNPQISLGYDATTKLLTSATDARGKVTSFSYNTNKDLFEVTPPGGVTLQGKTTLTYDTSSRVKTQTDGRGTTATLTYDGEDRVTRVDWSTGQWFTFTFDNNGNVTQRQDSAGNTTTYVYDKLNRRTSETFPGAITNTYTYDKASNLKTLVDGGGTTTYVYDTINRLDTITSPKPGGGTDVVDYDYTDAATRVATTTLPGGLKQAFETDLAGRLLQTTVKNSGGTTLKSLQYTYDPGGSRITAITDNAGNTTGYSYDVLGRLTDANTILPGPAIGDLYHYEYDKAGNRTRKVKTPAGGTAQTTSYAYNDVNEMCWSYVGTSSNACGSPPSGATSYAYDNAGNRTDSGGFGYDTLNRWTSLTFGSTFNLGYLSADNTELTSAGSSTFQNNLLGVGRETASGVTTSYTRTPGGTPVAQRDATNKRFLLPDHLGSTRWLADSSQNLTRSIAYDPDGATVSNTGTGPDPTIGYTGSHRVLGLYHNGARFYQPDTARWTQQDPLNQIGSLTEGNRFAYVGGNPINATDPSGQIACRDLGPFEGACDAGVEAIDTVIAAGTIAVNKLKDCAGAAVVDALSLKGGQVSIDLIKKDAGKLLIKKAGGPYAYALAGSTACIKAAL